MLIKITGLAIIVLSFVFICRNGNQSVLDLLLSRKRKKENSEEEK